MVKDIGLRIRQLRNEKKMTQEEFSTILGIKQANLSHIENKGSKISTEILDKIVSNFDINANWLFSGEGAMLRNEQIIGDISKSASVGNNINGNGINIHHTIFPEILAENYKNCNDIIKKLQEQNDNLISIINKLSDR
jgi:transcriptional regulator with XRE-family HTH domain